MKMAAEIQPIPGALPETVPRQSNRKAVLLAKIEVSLSPINDAVFLPDGNRIITASDDKLVRIWQKKDSGGYWPCLSHSMPSPPTSVHFDAAMELLFVGLDNGTVSELQLGDDTKQVMLRRTYLAHQLRVTAVCFTASNEWLLSISRDKYFQLHCTQTGRRLGGYQCNGWCMDLQYDEASNHAFVGDYSGEVHMLRLEKGEGGAEVTFVTSFKGHDGSIQSLAWDPVQKLLFSGSADHSIIVWDIGSQKGTAYELQGHHNKVTSLKHVAQKNFLISGGEDCIVGVWDMKGKRFETPEWQEGDACQQCGHPFFWNVRGIVGAKTMGVRRQHHCRRCGKAVCDPCSTHQAPLPCLGFEYPVRLCAPCHASLQPQDLLPMACFMDSKHRIVKVDIHEASNTLLTTGNDRLVKLWELPNPG